MWYLDKLILFLIPMIGVLTGILYPSSSLKIKRVVLSSLVIGNMSFLFPIFILNLPLFLGKFFTKYFVIRFPSDFINSRPMLYLTVWLMGIFLGVIFGMLINNKFLSIKLKIVSLNTIIMFITVLIGLTIGAIFSFEIDKLFYFNPLVFPFSTIFFTVVICLGGSLGAMVCIRSPKEEQK